MLSRAKTVKPSQARDVAVSLSICRRNPPQDAYTQAVDWVASHFFLRFSSVCLYQKYSKVSTDLGAVLFWQRYFQWNGLGKISWFLSTVAVQLSFDLRPNNLAPDCWDEDTRFWITSVTETGVVTLQAWALHVKWEIQAYEWESWHKT